MTWFKKFYKCSNNHEWVDEWDCLCNDRCPDCDEETEPYAHEEIDKNHLTHEQKTLRDAVIYGTGMIVYNYPLQSMNIPFIMLIRKDFINGSGSKRLPKKKERSDSDDGFSDHLHSDASDG